MCDLETKKGESSLKKALSASTIILFCLYAVLPLCIPVGISTDYELTMRGPLVFAGVLFACSLALTIAWFSWRDIVPGRTSGVLLALLFPLGVLTWFIVIIECDYGAAAMILACFSLACLAFLLSRPFGLLGLKIVSGGLAILLSMPIAFILFLELFFDLGVNTVVQEIESPDGTYLVQVIDSDQGALGGDTLVEVRRDDRTIDLLVVRLTKSPTCVYRGNWGEYKHMRIEWQDETTLLINGEIYHIDD